MAVQLVLRALGLGDLLTGIPALRALRRARPDDLVMLAAPQSLQPLVRMIGAVDELLPVAGLSQFDADVERYLRGGPGRDQLIPEVRVDQLRDLHAVNLHGSGPQSIDRLLGLEPVELMSHRHPDRPQVSGPEWDPERHEIDRWCSLLEWYGIPTDRGDLALDRPATHSCCPGAVVIHPGASYRSRRWPEERFAAVARALAREGHEIVITGTAGERPLGCWTAERAGLPRDVVLAGRTGLEELAALVAEAELVICGDTGVGHLATALDTRSVLLFGPTPPDRWGPTVDRERHIALWAGRVGDPLAHRRDAGLLRLQVDDVVEVAHRVLAA